MTISQDKRTGTKAGRKPKASPGTIAAAAENAKPPVELPSSVAAPLPSVVPELKRSKYAQVNVEWIDRRLVKNAPYNPRKISATAKLLLRESIQNHNLLEPFVWNRRTGNLVGGHQRISTLDQLEGREDYLVPVNPVDLSDVEEKSLNLMLNNQQLQGEHDAEKVLEMFRNNEIDLDLAGYSRIDLEEMGMNAGLRSEYLDSIFSDDARETLDDIADEVDSILDQSDILRKRDAEKKKERERIAATQADTNDDQEDSQDTNDSGDSEDDPEEYDSDDEDGNHTSKIHRERHRDKNQDSGKDSDSTEQPEPDELESIKQARKLTQNMMDAAESSYYGLIAFGSNAQREAFWELAGKRSHDKFISGNDIAKLLGWELPELPKPEPKKERSNKKGN